MTRERIELLEALARLILAVECPHPVRVAVDGPDAAGKTTLADELAPLIERSGRRVVRASIDGFHRSRAERHARGHDSPEGYFLDSFDYPALRAALLDPLGPGGSRQFRRRVFDFRTDRPVAVATETAPQDAILLFDGVFLFRRELLDCWDLRVFLEVPFCETVRRAVTRDAPFLGGEEAARQRYESRYVPGQQLYFREANPRAKADVVVENEDPDRPLFDRVARVTRARVAALDSRHP